MGGQATLRLKSWRVGIYLQREAVCLGHSLTSSLPTALFEISNLTMLSLRGLITLFSM